MRESPAGDLRGGALAVEAGAVHRLLLLGAEAGSPVGAMTPKLMKSVHIKY